MQTKKQSLIETLAGISIGFVIAMGSQYFIFPFFDIKTSHTDNFLIALFFTVISIIRSYFVRRFFNWWHIR